MAAPIAEELAKKQKEISVAEFFEKNKHILGFDSQTRAVLTAVKEGVDNSLDACEEAGILPEVKVTVNKGPSDDSLVVTIEDNGPGLTKKVAPNVFGRLLYGSRFHAIRQSRGQQGIGISAAVMYGQLSTGHPAHIISKIDEDQPAFEMFVGLDTKKNQPVVKRSQVILWDEKEHGTKVSIDMVGKYKRGHGSIIEYIRATAIVNPHARFVLNEPDGTHNLFERATDEMPTKTREIKPHPEGIELGTLLKMAEHTDTYKFTSFLVNEFSRVSYRTAKEICQVAEVPADMRPKNLTTAQAKAVLDAIKKVKIMAPPTDCLSPIGDMLIKKGLKKEIDSKFCYTVTREPKVFAGTPFQVEAGLVYGGDLAKDDQVKILRFANRVPLLFQQGGCVVTKAIEGMNWRQYGFDQPGSKGIPKGPAMILVHVASTNVPFTSESKEAISDVDEIYSEVQNALKECSRRLKTHINKKARLEKVKDKFEIIQDVIPSIAEKSADMLGKPVPDITPVVTKIMNIVYIDSAIAYEVVGKGEEKQTTTKVKILVNNYTPKKRDLHLFCKVPEAMITLTEPPPDKIEDGLISWKLKNLESSKTQEITFNILGLDKGDFDDCDLFYKKVPGEIIGADPI